MMATVPGASSAATLRGAPVTGGPVNAAVAGALLGDGGKDSAAGAMLGTCICRDSSRPWMMSLDVCRSFAINSSIKAWMPGTQRM